MATSPQFAATPRCAVANIATANANRDGTGTMGTVYTAGSSGSRIDEVVIKSTVTTTAGVVRLFIHDGTTARLFDEQAIAAQSASSNSATARYRLTYDNLYLPNGYSLRASTERAESINVIALGGDF